MKTIASNVASFGISKSAENRGISLIEGVLYLVLALGVIVGGIVFFQNAQLSSNVTDTSRAAVGMTSEVRGLYANQQDFTGLDDATVLASGAVPSNFNAGGGVITNPFNGTVTFGANAGDAEFFDMSVTGLTAEACTRLAPTSAQGEGPLGTGITSIQVDVGGTAGTPSPTLLGDAAAGVAFTPANAAAACGDDATIIATYAR